MADAVSAATGAATAANPLASLASGLVSGLSTGFGSPQGISTGPAVGGNVNVGGLNVPAYPFAGGGPAGLSFDTSGGFSNQVLVGVAVAAAVGLVLLVIKKAARHG